MELFKKKCGSNVSKCTVDLGSFQERMFHTFNQHLCMILHSRLQGIDQCRKFPPFSSRQKIELTFMRLAGSGASPGNLSQLFSIVHEVAVEVF